MTFKVRIKFDQFFIVLVFDLSVVTFFFFDFIQYLSIYKTRWMHVFVSLLNLPAIQSIFFLLAT